MNSRNLDYIRPNNLLEAKKLADDKLLSKKILKKNDVPVPTLIAKIKSRDDLESFNWQDLPETFALKPNRGFGGEGILIVYGKKKNHEHVWIKADGSLVTIADLKDHIRNILDGSFSLSNTPDVAFFEERLQLLKLFKPYAFKGIPDIRVIVFNKVPVMAMLRLPTRESGGKANLQQNAIGVGIDMASGITTTAIQGKRGFIEQIPNTRLVLSGIKIPRWRDILALAVKTQEISGLGFLGADIAIDKERGPVILELNARPGLSIQLANRSGLKERMDRVAGLAIKTSEKGVRVGMDLFGGEVEEELEEISGKKIISTIERVKLIGRDGKEVEAEAKIDTGAYSTSIDLEIAKTLGFQETIDAFSALDMSQYKLTPESELSVKKDILNKFKDSVSFLEDVSVIFSSSGSSVRPVVKIVCILDGVHTETKANIISRENLKHPMIVGRRDLKNFLIEIK